MSRVLVLNATCEPINITNWRRAVALVFRGKAEILEDAGEHLLAPGMPLPRVIRLSRYVAVPYMTPAPTRNNILMRDRYCCRYCGRTGGRLTLDHVMPRSRGGLSNWKNLVCACSECNLRKGNRTPEEAGMLLKQGISLSFSRLEFEILFGGNESKQISCWLKYLPERVALRCRES